MTTWLVWGAAVTLIKHPLASLDKRCSAESEQLGRSVFPASEENCYLLTLTVTITVLPCKYPESLEQGKGIPIYMGIQNPDKCLFCEEVDGQPALQLKVGDPEKSHKDKKLAFLFL